MFLKSLGAILLVISFIVLPYNTSFADEYHYTNILVGDRASGMGGAYTAVSDDPTGMYYNPAGIVYSTMRNLSASVNAYYNLKKKYKGVIGGRGWERTSSALLPNYFGIIQPLGMFKIGFSYAVPDSILEDQDQTFYDLPSTVPGTTVSRYIINFNNEDNTYNFGPSIAKEIAKDFSAGITLYVHQRKAQIILNQLVNLSDDRYEWTNEYLETNEWGLRPVLGFMWSPMEKISLGITVSKTILFDSDTTRQYIYKGIDYGGNDIDRVAFSTDTKKKYPLQVSTGIAYFPSPRILIAGDVTYYLKVDDSTFGDRESVLNAAIGTEYYLSRNWAMRAGIFTNMANTPEIKTGISDQPEHIDLYGGSLSLSRFTKNTSVTAGGSMSYGTGKAQVKKGYETQDAEALAWTIFISSSYSY
ncbi:MAG: hypothetical protein AB1478_00320 [Nitrospirota bacterium]